MTQTCARTGSGDQNVPDTAITRRQFHGLGALSIVWCACALSIAGTFTPGELRAQSRMWALDAAINYSWDYPDRLQDGCGDTAGLMPSMRATYAGNALLAAEAGVGIQFQIPRRASRPCGVSIPPLPGDEQRVVDIDRSNTSLVSELRIVLVPVRSSIRSWRLIGGGSYYFSGGLPAWIVGTGYTHQTAIGRIVIDLERWNVGTRYDLERFEPNAPDPVVGHGREWHRFWHVRLGFAIIRW